MKRLILILSIYSFIFLILSCEKSTVEPNKPLPEQKDTFENMTVNISTKVDKVILDSIITIETKCLPKFDGKGTISLVGDGMMDSSIYQIISPIQDTLIKNNDTTSTTTLPVNFSANDTFKLNWKINLKTPVSYSFVAKAIFDSIFVEDSSDLLNFDYDYLKNQGFRYQPRYAISFPLTLKYP